MQGLYKLTFKDGSIYIGMSKDLGVRYSQHLSALAKGSHKNKKLQERFTKYGPPSFEVIEVFEDYETLSQAERALIKKYDSDANITLLNIAGTYTPIPKADVNKKYTEEQKLEALELFKHEFTGKEIAEFTGIPMGTLYRWKNESLDPKSKQPGTCSAELQQLRDEVAELKQQLDEILPFVRRQIKADTKNREEYESNNPSGFRLKRA